MTYMGMDRAGPVHTLLIGFAISKLRLFDVTTCEPSLHVVQSLPLPQADTLYSLLRTLLACYCCMAS